jgi:hypothetical protein
MRIWLLSCIVVLYAKRENSKFLDNSPDISDENSLREAVAGMTRADHFFSWENSLFG